MYTLTVCSSKHDVEYNYTATNEKKVQIRCRLECRYFEHIFAKWNNNIIFVLINKQLKCFKNFSGVFCRLLHEKC
jgi:hypothetical protein